MGNVPEGLRTVRAKVLLELAEAERLALRRASVLHSHAIMEALVLTTAMMLSGLIAVGSTRAVLGVVLHAITRDADAP